MLVRKLRYVAVVSLLAIMVTACTPAAAPTKADVTSPTQAESQEESQAEQPISEPSTTEGSAPAQEGGWCSGTSIVFFPGGSPSDGFETVVNNGAIQAAADTGVNVEYVWYDWDPAKIVTQLQEAVAPNPDGTPSWAIQVTNPIKIFWIRLRPMGSSSPA